METTIFFLGYIEIMEKKMETTTLYWGSPLMMENQMEKKMENDMKSRII